MSDTRRKAVTEEKGEPSLIFPRRAYPAAPVELLIVKDGHTDVWTITRDRLAALASELLGFYVTGPKA